MIPLGLANLWQGSSMKQGRRRSGPHASEARPRETNAPSPPPAALLPDVVPGCQQPQAVSSRAWLPHCEQLQASHTLGLIFSGPWDRTPGGWAPSSLCHSQRDGMTNVEGLGGASQPFPEGRSPEGTEGACFVALGFLVFEPQFPHLQGAPERPTRPPGIL